MTQTISLEQARQLAGQLVMIRLPITELDQASAEYLKANHIRAICLFRQNMQSEAQLKKLTSDLRAVMGPDALIAIDQEGGAVVRSTWVPAPPAAMALGAADDEALCEQVGAAVARAVKALGFNWNFAPVLDLNNNPHNPVISERSFSSDPAQAARLALSWMRGSLAEGVACCVKHFPGHGDTHVDSHRDLPHVDKSLAQLNELEFAPFKQAVAQEVPAIMTAHIVYPALDADNPATMSSAILSDLLRRDWGYRGVVITDGMDMHAIAGRYGVGPAAVRALSAGADMVMALGTPETQQESLQALAEFIQSGGISLAQVEEKLARMRQLTQTYPCQDSAYQTDLADRILMAQAWKKGLTQVGEFQAPAAGSKVRLVVRADVVSDGVSEAGIAADKVEAMLSQLYQVDTVLFSEADDFDWQALPKDGVYTILASTIRIRYSEQVRANWRPDLHLALWNPFQVLDIEAPALITYGFAAPALDAVRACLQGEIQAKGQFPVAGVFDHVAA